MAAQQPWTGIQVETSFFPLSFFLYLCTPTMVIDGVAHRRPWGTHSFQLEGGLHTVRIFFGYLFMSNCGDNSINVVVHSHCIHQFKFEMLPSMFPKGSSQRVPQH